MADPSLRRVGLLGILLPMDGLRKPSHSRNRYAPGRPGNRSNPAVREDRTYRPRPPGPTGDNGLTGPENEGILPGGPVVRVVPTLARIREKRPTRLDLR